MEYNNADRQLDAIFAAYREASPDPEASANFMPQLWQRIDAKRTVPMTLRKLAHVFLSAAAAICLMMSLLQYLPQSSGISMSYIDFLDETNHASLVYSDVLHNELPSVDSNLQ